MVMGKGFINASVFPTKISSCLFLFFSDTHMHTHPYRHTQRIWVYIFLAHLQFLSSPLWLFCPPCSQASVMQKLEKWKQSGNEKTQIDHLSGLWTACSSGLLIPHYIMLERESVWMLLTQSAGVWSQGDAACYVVIPQLCSHRSTHSR